MQWGMKELSTSRMLENVSLVIKNLKCPGPCWPLEKCEDRDDVEMPMVPWDKRWWSPEEGESSYLELQGSGK